MGQNAPLTSESPGAKRIFLFNYFFMTSFKKILEIFTSYSYCCINAVIAVDYVHRLFR